MLIHVVLFELQSVARNSALFTYGYFNINVIKPGNLYTVDGFTQCIVGSKVLHNAAIVGNIIEIV